MLLESWLVSPIPVLRCIVTIPEPALMVVPLASVITAVPASRFASTTPFTTVSFAVALKLPLAVVIFALMRMLRPACNVREPPVVPVTAISSLIVMSLFACSVRLVPALRIVVSTTASNVAFAPGISVNLLLPVTELVIPPFVTVMFFGSSNSVPATPCDAVRFTQPWKRRALPETSACPPFPPAFPPVALIVPA